VAGRAAEADRTGRLDPEVVAGLRASGINRLLLPTELDGLSASPRRSVEVVERIAACDGSTAWSALQHCTDVAVEVAGTAHRLGGGAAAYRGSPLLRALRDLETVRQHAIFNRGLRPHLARTVAGTDEAHPPFVL
jgi:alkylation response protein AidB-like acyl-CoA dehydrogenase